MDKEEKAKKENISQETGKKSSKPKADKALKEPAAKASEEVKTPKEKPAKEAKPSKESKGTKEPKVKAEKIKAEPKVKAEKIETEPKAKAEKAKGEPKAKTEKAKGEVKAKTEKAKTETKAKSTKSSKGTGSKSGKTSKSSGSKKKPSAKSQKKAAEMKELKALAEAEVAESVIPGEPKEGFGVENAAEDIIDVPAFDPETDEGPEPTGSKSVFLTMKDNGKLAIAVNRDGSIVYENNETEVLEPVVKSHMKKVMIAIVVLLIAFGCLYIYQSLLPKQVTVIVQTLENTNVINTEVSARNVREVLTKLDIPVSDIDQVLPYYDSPVSDDMTISVTKRLEATATVAGEEQRIILIPGTVEENLEFNEIEYDSDDIVSPSLTDNMVSTSQIEVKDVVKVVKDKEKTIEFKSKIILDPTLSSGTRVDTEGKDGIAIYTYTTTYINGEKQDTVKEFKKWKKKPQDNTIRLGTSVTGNSGEVKILRTFVSNTTAYYCGPKARGALGTRCYYGTCAVDPKVFPYGSRFWVTGYGYCQANDCGGAIKGTKLDLYMRSVKECYRWGRRYVTTYLLG